MNTIIPSLLTYHKDHFLRVDLNRRKWIETIILLVGLVIFWLQLIAIGLNLPRLVQLLFHTSRDPVEVLPGVLLVYFAIDLVTRLLLSKPPVVPLPFLPLAKRRSLVLTTLCLKALNIFTITWLIFVASLTHSIITPRLGVNISIFFLAVMFLLALISTGVTLVYKLFSLHHPLVGKLVFLALIPLAFPAPRAGLLGMVHPAMDSVLQAHYPILVVMIIALVLVLYAGYRMLRASVYLDDPSPSKPVKSPGKHGFLPGSPFALSPLAVLEYRLMLRNRRPRGYLLTAALGYPLFIVIILFFPFPEHNPVFVRVYELFSVMILSVAFVFTFGLFSISFSGSFLPLILTQPIRPDRFIRNKYYLLASSVLILSIVPFFLFLYAKPHLVSILVVFGLWNMGITTILLLFFSLFNIERCNLENRIFNNFEAWGFFQSLLVYMIVLLPVILHFSISFIWGDSIAHLTLVIPAVPVLLFHRTLLHGLTRIFSRRKFIILNKLQNKEGAFRWSTSRI